jgi:hypothetical protein
MASNINILTIDSNFPIPGQDNDTQGFRDNFTAITKALSTASSEITDIQVNYASLQQNNNFNTNEIQNAIFRDVGYLVQDNGAVTNDQAVAINYLQGSYQKYAIASTGTTNFSVVNWPSSGVAASVRVQVQSTSTSSMIFFSSLATGSTLYVDDSITNPYPLGLEPVIFEISSPDAGYTEFVTARSVVTASTSSNIVFAKATFNSTETSTSAVTGAVVVSGGIGVAKDIYVGGTLNATTATLSGLSLNGKSVNQSTVVNSVYTASNATKVSGTIAVDYSNGSYQVFTVDNSATNEVSFYISNWPTDNQYHSAKLEVNFTNNSFDPYSATYSNASRTFRNTCTTVGLSQTLTIGSDPAGTSNIGEGWIVSNNPIVTAGTTLTTVISVIDSINLYVLPAIDISSPTTLYFFRGATSPPSVQVVAQNISTTLKLNNNLPSNGVVAQNSATVIFDVFTRDNGVTQFLENINIFKDNV